MVLDVLVTLCLRISVIVVIAVTLGLTELVVAAAGSMQSPAAVQFEIAPELTVCAGAAPPPAIFAVKVTWVCIEVLLQVQKWIYA